MIVIEAKPSYSIDDKNKLTDLLECKKDRLISSLKKFASGKREFAGVVFDMANYVPLLAFGTPSYRVLCIDEGFWHIYVKSLDQVKMVIF